MIPNHDRLIPNLPKFTDPIIIVGEAPQIFIVGLLTTKGYRIRVASTTTQGAKSTNVGGEGFEPPASCL